MSCPGVIGLQKEISQHFLLMATTKITISWTLIRSKRGRGARFILLMTASSTSCADRFMRSKGSNFSHLAVESLLTNLAERLERVGGQERCRVGQNTRKGW